jgi:gluconolactonase
MNSVELRPQGVHKSVQFEVLAEDLGFPEGPIAMPDGSLLFVEIRAQRLSRLAENGKVHVVADLGGSPNGAAIGPDGSCYVCNSGGFKWHNHPSFGWMVAGQPEDYSGGRIERVDLASGKVETLYDKLGDFGALQGPNDLVFDRHGGFWFTDSGKVRGNDRDHGGIYYAKADGTMIKRVIYPIIHPHPNGIGLSPDESMLYYAETVTGRVWAFALNGPGAIDPAPFPSPHGGRLLGTAPGYTLLDSLAVEAKGNVCVGALMDGGIIVFTPEGELIERVSMPDFLVTNLCFGGADMLDAFVTMSGTGKIARMRWPRPGLRLAY